MLAILANTLAGSAERRILVTSLLEVVSLSGAVPSHLAISTNLLFLVAVPAAAMLWAH